MLAAQDLDALWIVGANPLKEGPLASKRAFVVVQDMFLTESAQRADIVLPAGSAYEKNGTVTNVCGEVQRLKRAVGALARSPTLKSSARSLRKWVSPRRWVHGSRNGSTMRSGRVVKATIFHYRW